MLGSVLGENEDNYQLSIVAPDRERSAIGHAITMHKPLRVEKINFLDKPILEGWSVNGTPSDCVKLAVEAILETSPDLVVSGINRGSNLGNDIFYSGTVSAAVEGLIFGIPSIAVSLTGRKAGPESFLYAARLIDQLIPGLLSSDFPKSTLLNINVPVAVNQIKGIRVTRLGNRRYSNIFDKRVDPRGMFYYWMAGELVDDITENDDCDTTAVRNGYISITPVHFKLTDFEVMADLEGLLKDISLNLLDD